MEKLILNAWVTKKNYDFLEKLAKTIAVSIPDAAREAVFFAEYGFFKPVNTEGSNYKIIQPSLSRVFFKNGSASCRFDEDFRFFGNNGVNMSAYVRNCISGLEEAIDKDIRAESVIYGKKCVNISINRNCLEKTAKIAGVFDLNQCEIIRYIIIAGLFFQDKLKKGADIDFDAPTKQKTIYITTFLKKLLDSKVQHKRSRTVEKYISYFMKTVNA